MNLSIHFSYGFCKFSSTLVTNFGIRLTPGDNIFTMSLSTFNVDCNRSHHAWAQEFSDSLRSTEDDALFYSVSLASNDSLSNPQLLVLSFLDFQFKPDLCAQSRPISRCLNTWDMGIGHLMPGLGSPGLEHRSSLAAATGTLLSSGFDLQDAPLYFRGFVSRRMASVLLSKQNQSGND